MDAGYGYEIAPIDVLDAYDATVKAATAAGVPAPDVQVVCDNSSEGLPRLSRRCSQQNWHDLGAAGATNGRLNSSRRATESEQYCFVQ